MVKAWAYDVMYRRGAPWEIGPREELVGLVERGVLAPADLPRAVDLGCGSGANSVFLAEHGFDVVGVDFSPVALDKARAAAAAAGVGDRCRFVQADLTAGVARVLGTVDLVVDYGTLDDLRAPGRAAMAAAIKDIVRPGSRFVLWCFHGPRAELPWISFHGASRMAPGLEPGEEERLFGDRFTIERLAAPPPGSGAACFLMVAT